jgi:hypothetical protein
MTNYDPAHRRIWMASKRQAPVAQRFDDLLELLIATSNAMVDNNEDHDDPIDYNQVLRWQHDLASVAHALRVAGQARRAGS